MAIRSRPTWIRKIGLTRVVDVGNGSGVVLEWEEASPVSVGDDLYYNIYMADTRFAVFDSAPYAITQERGVIINLPNPGNVYYLAVRATQFDDDTVFDITDLELNGYNLYLFPTSTILLNDLPAIDDGYTILVEDVSTFPDSGELIIGTEIIRYSSVDRINDAFIVSAGDRAIILTTLASHSSGDTVNFWHGVEDGNTIIRQATAAWLNTDQQDDYCIGSYDSDADGYRVAPVDNITTDLSADEEDYSDTPAYDFCGYHRPSLEETFTGQCVGSYVGGEFNGGRGFNLNDRVFARLEVQLNVLGENAILLRRKWTGRRCRCSDLRYEHPKERCPYCYGTGFTGGFDRYVNTRPVSESSRNTRGFIKVRPSPYKDDVQLQSDQGLTQDVNRTAWTLATPIIKDRDIIILFDQYGVEEFRYECQYVNRNKLMFGVVGRQEFVMIRLDKTDVVYQFDISEF